VGINEPSTKSGQKQKGIVGGGQAKTKNGQKRTKKLESGGGGAAGKVIKKG